MWNVQVSKGLERGFDSFTACDMTYANASKGMVHADTGHGGVPLSGTLNQGGTHAVPAAPGGFDYVGCEATTKKGKPCKRDAVKDGLCMVHMERDDS